MAKSVQVQISMMQAIWSKLPRSCRPQPELLWFCSFDDPPMNCSIKVLGWLQ